MSFQPNDLFLQALQFHHAGRIVETRTNLKKLLKRIPAHVEALHLLGITYLQTREMEKGVANIKRAVAIRPDFAEAQFNLGNALYDLQHYEEAITAFRKVIASRPDHIKAQCNLANTLVAMQQYEDAIRQYCEVLRQHADNIEALIGLGVAYAELKELQQAITFYEQALSIQPTHADACNNLGYAYSATGQWDKAEKAFRKAIEFRPHYVDAHVGLARILVSQKNHEEAVSSYMRAHTIRADAQSAYELAEVLLALKRYDEAATYYRKAVDAQSGFLAAEIGLGIALSHARRFEEAKHVFLHLLQNEPSHYDALNNLGNAEFELKQFEQAAIYYQKAIDQIPQISAGHIGLGNAYKELGQIPEAIEKYQHVLTLEPESPEARSGLGIVYVELNDHARAIDYYQEAIAIKPDYAGAIYNLGVVYERLKIFDLAKEHYAKAFKIDEQQYDAHWNHTLIELLQGNFQHGWQAYEYRWHLPTTIHLAKPNAALWLGEKPISGKSLLIQYEQGNGDAIQMIRYLPRLQAEGIRCFLQCPEALTPLLKASFPNVPVFSDHAFPDGLDFYIPIMSLPLAMKTFDFSEIPNNTPYLQAPAARLSFWQAQLRPTLFSVGLIWRGNPGHSNDKNRSTSLRSFLPLITQYPQVQFVTMQKDMTATELEMLSPYSNVRILDEMLSNFAESAAVMECLDLIITIDSAPAHLAGALNRPVWLLLPFNGEWRWLLERSDSPWYPSMRIFRQPERGNWEAIIQDVSLALKNIGDAINV